MWAVVFGDDLGRVEAVAGRLPNEQMAVSVDRHRRGYDDGVWMLCDGVHVVALKQENVCAATRSLLWRSPYEFRAWSIMRVLFIGGTGFISASVSRQAIAKGLDL